MRQLAWRGPHTPGIDRNTALALSLLWVPGLGMFTGMPAWPVGEEKRFPEMEIPRPALATCWTGEGVGTGTAEELLHCPELNPLHLQSLQWGLAWRLNGIACLQTRDHTPLWSWGPQGWPACGRGRGSLLQPGDATVWACKSTWKNSQHVVDASQERVVF